MGTDTNLAEVAPAEHYAIPVASTLLEQGLRIINFLAKSIDTDALFEAVMQNLSNKPDLLDLFNKMAHYIKERDVDSLDS